MNDEAKEIIECQKAEIARIQAELDRIRKANITFIKKVAKLRELQKEYFKTRSHDVLVQSKAIEAEVDTFLKRCFDRLAQQDPDFSEKVSVIKDIFDAEPCQ